MKFGTLELNNFLTITSARIELADRGLLLVQGINDADSSAGSNGAGKSTIPDGLCWIAYGVTARGVSGDAVINRTAKKDTLGRFTVTEGDMEYTITRYRKHATGKNALHVSQRELSTGKVIDLTRGTDKETQEVVVSVLGSSLEVFQGAIYAGQERMPDLPAMTDKQLKTLLEEASGTEILATGYAEARQRLAGVKAKVETTIARFDSEKARMAALTGSDEGELLDLQGKQKAHNDGRKARASAHLANIKPCTEQIEERNKKIYLLDEPAIDREITDIEGELAAHTSKGEELGRLHGEVSRAQRALDLANGAGTTLALQVRTANEGIAQIDKLVGTPCGECGKEYCAHDLDAARATRQAGVDKLKATVPNVKADMESTKAALAAAQKAFDDFKAALPDVSAQNNRLKDLREKKGVINTLRTEISLIERNVEAHRANAKAELTNPNPWDKAVEVKQEEISKCQGVLDHLTPILDGAEDELALYDEAVKVFGPGGVRAQILDMITPFLNEQTREYLGALSDGNIHAVWSTLTTTSKGELREKFNIEVTHDLGGDSFAALSGGEKRKVRLSAFMALQDLVSSRATKPLELFIADEIDHALDPAGLERLMGILERKARERGTVLVISHTDLSDWVPDTVIVRKTGVGQSTIDGTISGTY